jgi:acetoacetyl-CoA synthetase
MKVEVYDEAGKPVYAKKGELVCTRPFPSMPIGFWDDADGKRYHDAYFAKFPKVWCHGDYVELNERGGMIIYGRSDAVLNPGGVRIGTAEIYRQVEQLNEVLESLVIGQDWNNDVRVILRRCARASRWMMRSSTDQDRSRQHHAAPCAGQSARCKTFRAPRAANRELAVRNVVPGQAVKTPTRWPTRKRSSIARESGELQS